MPGVATKDQEVGGFAVKKDDRVFLNIAYANVNVSINDNSLYIVLRLCSSLQESVFAAPNTVDPSRGTKGYLPGGGLFLHLGENLTTKVIEGFLLHCDARPCISFVFRS